MSSCEKCWREAKGITEEYINLIKSRECTPEEQAGWYATVCPNCKRKTVHQYTMQCLVCRSTPGVRR